MVERKNIDINITEGCIAYSYSINGVEWVDLTDKNSEKYDPNIVNAVCAELLDRLEEHRPDIPRFLIDNLYEVGTSDPNIDFDQDIFIELVKNDKDTKTEYLGSCDECGDSIYNWKLIIEVPEYNLD